MKKVAVYCRVSTEKEEQINSFESQKRYFERYIQAKEGWQFYKIYADEGISGTSTIKRKAFNEMMEAAKRGSFQMIVTKEVSRFARNTVDTLYYTRELKRVGVEVYFITDHICTMDPDAELRLTIMASMAQEESRKTSERVKWGQKRRMEQGVVFGRDLLGYDVRGGKLFINEEGAKIVRYIYYKFLEEEKGVCSIAKELSKEGIPTMTKKTSWNATTILRILKNEKYCGDLVQKKTFTPDYLTHQKKYNDGEEEKVVLFQHHEGIITKEQFERTKEELRRRSMLTKGKTMKMSTGVCKATSRYCLSGKIKCAFCGSSFVARLKRRSNGTSYLYWRCYEAMRYGKREEGKQRGCNMNVQIQDKDFLVLIQTIIKEEIQGEGIVNCVQEVIESIERVTECCREGEGEKVREEKVKSVQEKIERLVELYISGSISKEEYSKILLKYRKIQKNILDREVEEITNIEIQSTERKIDERKRVMSTLVSGEEKDEIFYRNLVETILVNGRDEIIITFRGLAKPWVKEIT